MNENEASVEEPIRVLYLAAEADPLIKVGGLGDVAGSLPRELNALDPGQLGGRRMDVRLVLPLHPGILQKFGNDLTPVGSVSVHHRKGPLKAEIFSLDVFRVPIYLISGGPIPKEGPVYSTDPYVDGSKFAFTSLAALELCRLLDWRPHILHANDWHTAVAIYALRLVYRGDPFYAGIRTVLSVHNLPFLGAGTESALAGFGLVPTQDTRLPEWARGMPLPLGLLTADCILAVSPHYAREILTPEFGSGLHQFLQSRRESIGGILNGIDLSGWDPSMDQALTARFGPAELDKRSANKTALQNQFELDGDAQIPLLILIGRMDPQKGVDIALEGLQLIQDLPWQAVILGTGIPSLEEAARNLEKRNPRRIRAVIRFDASLARQLYGGGDILLMPSRYEPCGLAQMIAMRYGCIPYARATGGLVDTIRDQFSSPDGTGFLFSEAAPEAFAEHLSRVINFYQDRPTWQAVQNRAMAQDFSWQRSALSYAQTYLSLIEGK